MFIPSYIEVHRKGNLTGRVEKAYRILESCRLCPRRCEVNRLKNEKGICRTGSSAAVSSYNAHFGEEAPLVGSHDQQALAVAREEGITRLDAREGRMNI